MSLALRYAVRSDRGLVRGNNEDSVYAGPRLLAIADGMGGHAAGEVASKIVIGRIGATRRGPPARGHAQRAAQRRSRRPTSGIADAVHNNADLDGMGTTLTAMRFTGARSGWSTSATRGPTCCATISSAQITHDDTYVQSLVDSGRLTPEEASHHPRKSVILRALMGSEVDPDVSIREARARRPLPAVHRRPVRRRHLGHAGRDAVRGRPRRSPPTASSTWHCAAAARTTSPASSPTWSTRTTPGTTCR